MNVEDIGRELGVRYVLEGSVRKAGDRVRVTAQLIDAPTGGHVWSERYDRDLSDIFALQTEIAEGVAGLVGGEIFRAEQQRLARRPTESLTAYEGYQRATSFVLRPTRRNLEAARALLSRAIEADPNFAAAHAALGATYWGEYAAGWNRDPALLDRAEQLGRRAIELDPAFVQGHVVTGWVAFLRGDLDEAVAAADWAIELMPSFVVAHTLRGLALLRQGSPFEAIRSVRRAQRLSPRAALNPVLISIAFANLAADRRQEAVRLLEQARNSASEVLPGRVVLAVLYEQDGAHGPGRGRGDAAHPARPHRRNRDGIGPRPRPRGARGVSRPSPRGRVAVELMVPRSPAKQLVPADR